MLTVFVSLVLLTIAAASAGVIATSLVRALAIAGNLRRDIAAIDAREALVQKLENCGQSHYRRPAQRKITSAPYRGPRGFTARCANA